VPVITYDTDLSKNQIIELASQLSESELKLILERTIKVPISKPLEQVLLSSAIVKYKDKELINKASLTQQSYTITLRQFSSAMCQSFGFDPVVSELMPHHVQNFLDSLKKEGLRPKTLNRKLGTLKAFSKFCLKNDFSPIRLTEGVETSILEIRIPVSLSAEEAKQLICQAGKTRNSLRDQALIALGIYAGCRISEETTLKVGDIDFDQCCIMLFGKGSKERSVPIHPDLELYLKNYMNYSKKTNARKETKLFDIGNRRIQKLVRDLAQNLDLDHNPQRRKVTHHSLRHTFTMVLLDCGATLESARQLLGHETLAALKWYTTLNMKQKRAAINKINIV